MLYFRRISNSNCSCYRFVCGYLCRWSQWTDQKQLSHIIFFLRNDFSCWWHLGRGGIISTTQFPMVCMDLLWLVLFRIIAYSRVMILYWVFTVIIISIALVFHCNPKWSRNLSSTKWQSLMPLHAVQRSATIKQATAKSASDWLSRIAYIWAMARGINRKRYTQEFEIF